MISLLLIANIALCQDTDIPSNLKDFEGIWQFIPPKGSNDTAFTALEIFKPKKLLRLTYWHNSKEVYIRERICGFEPKEGRIIKLSDLVEVGQHKYFYEPNPKAPNDSIKYFRQASPSCFASFNGLGTDNYDPPAKGKPNFFLFNFNGRENEYHRQIQYLPNYIIAALVENKKELSKVEVFLGTKYSKIKVVKSYIYSLPMQKTNIYLLKDDVLEIIEEKDEWFKIRYYGKKTIEGWIKKTDVTEK